MKPVRFHWWPRALAALALLVLALWGWTQVSPWPSAMVIRAAFKSGGAHASAALSTVPRVPAKFAVSYTRTIRDGSRYGSDSISTAFTTEKIAVFAPMPSARQMTATVLVPRCLRIVRVANRMS